MKLPLTVHNRLSYAGAAIALLAFMLFVFLSLLHTFTGAAQAPYAGLLIFGLMPAILVFGLLLIPLGMFFEWRYVRRTSRVSIPTFPVIDLNQPHHRNAALIFAIGSVLVLFVTAFGGYSAYEATESVAFCGTLCHTVMQPEYTTYRNSPHARVRCVDCHVGPGADWYVKSKLTGAYQVYAVLLDKFPRPIPSPISSLRPAQQTCEQCHWPEQFYGAQQNTRVYFLPDEKNTRWVVDLLVKIGGGNPAAGRTEGIHWHMNIADQVEYIATDAKRQQIPWVRITDRSTGEVREYASTENPLTEREIESMPKRTMDCMDCHNRPAHILRSPRFAVNLALSSGAIDVSLPFIRRQGVELLAADHASLDAARVAISEGLTAFYRSEYPEIAKGRSAVVTQAIRQLRRIYEQNFFPTMRATWREYPDTLGHLDFEGCFRCHDNQHKSAEGKIIRSDCRACHTIMSQGPAGQVTYSDGPDGLEFQHPEDIDDAWQLMKCSTCHSGLNP
jgi:nitrate/TMAO reductase-like tetraheme cytochrome c subunit